MTDVLTVVGDEGDGEAAGGVVAVGSELNPQLGGASSEGGGRGQAATRLEGDPTIGRLCTHTHTRLGYHGNVTLVYQAMGAISTPSFIRPWQPDFPVSR